MNGNDAAVARRRILTEHELLMPHARDRLEKLHPLHRCGVNGTFQRRGFHGECWMLVPSCELRAFTCVSNTIPAQSRFAEFQTSLRKSPSPWRRERGVRL